MGQPIDNNVFYFVGPIFVFQSFFWSFSWNSQQYLLIPTSSGFFPFFFLFQTIFHLCTWKVAFIFACFCAYQGYLRVSAISWCPAALRRCSSRMLWFPGWQAFSCSVFEQTSSIQCVSPSNQVVCIADPIRVPTAYEIRQLGLDLWSVLDKYRYFK